MNDDGYLVLAIADDFLTEHEKKDPVDVYEAYDWLVAKAREIGEQS